MADKITREHTLEVVDIRRSAEGRTLIGRALRYNVPEVVTDDGGRTHYLEEWMPGVFARSIAERGDKIPLYALHDTHRLPFGAVKSWLDEDNALGFAARVSRTQAGDELLELINDGAMTGVSVGAVPRQDHSSVRGGRSIVQRIEAKLLELSLCPLGQLEGAEVLAVRAADLPPAGTPRLDSARAWLSTLDLGEAEPAH